MTLAEPQVSMHAARERSFRPWWLWVATAFAFPPAGLLGHAVAGGVDRPASAALAGAITGAVIGVGQWLVLRRRGVGLEWVLGTSAGLALGLTVGAAIVSYGTDRRALMLMGAVSGLAVGIAQAATAKASLARLTMWASVSALSWTVGWMVSAGVIDTTDQWAVFGISGALLVAFTQSFFIARVVETRASRIGVQA